MKDVNGIKFCVFAHSEICERDLIEVKDLKVEKKLKAIIKVLKEKRKKVCWKWRKGY